MTQRPGGWWRWPVWLAVLVPLVVTGLLGWCCIRAGEGLTHLMTWLADLSEEIKP